MSADEAVAVIRGRLDKARDRISKGQFLWAGGWLELAREELRVQHLSGALASDKATELKAEIEVLENAGLDAEARMRGGRHG